MIPSRNKYGARKTVVRVSAATALLGPWAADEDDRLVALRHDRVTLARIAEILGRSLAAVENRWSRVRKARGLAVVRGEKIADPVSHFWERVDQSGGPNACWPWTGRARYLAGYGALTFNMGFGSKNYGAHRVAFFLANGRPQGLGLHVMHSCDNKPCCNPAHLSEGTRNQNMRDAYARGRLVAVAPKGEAHHRARLTEVQVRAVRALIAGGAKRADVAALAGLSIPAIDNITSRRNWKCVA